MSSKEAVDFMTKYVNGLSDLMNEASVDNTEMFYDILRNQMIDVSTYKTKNHYKSRYINRNWNSHLEFMEN